ncbi:nucleotide disphospho-sugar-binding domain-containing protein [Amycolatopsis sp. cmx-4-68]|uniref:nucleotide disphospho-sugar-binding domain-containing protein n=1 Tax=Amycolatopsis sp. cmx-4-68 TaxID=2790938 RepID=UPI00397D70F7
MRLLFTTAPLRGHLFPLVPLAWAARAAGHEVLVATTEAFAPVVLRCGLPVTAWGAAPGFVDLVGGEPPVTEDSAARRRAEHGHAFGRIARACLPGARQLVGAWRPDLVVSERAEFAGPLAAAAHDVPVVAYHWGVAPLAEYGRAAAIELGAVAPDPVGTLDPWPPGMRLPHAAGHEGVRGGSFNGDAQLPDWVAEPGRPRVCVTFGTVLPGMAALGLRESVAPMLKLLKELDVELCVAAADDVLADWPELAAAADRAGRLPLAQVLPTCAAMVNHGGQGTVLTALEAGCPQLVLPQFDDQFDNAAAVAAVGAGLRLSLDEVSPERVADGCRELLDEPAFTTGAVRAAAAVRAQRSPAEAVGLLEKLVAA